MPDTGNAKEARGKALGQKCTSVLFFVWAHFILALYYIGLLYQMVQLYCFENGWEWKHTGEGGKLELTITGDCCWPLLMLEAGVHRIQRVPKTETQV